jgi:hypothetical protein
MVQMGRALLLPRHVKLPARARRMDGALREVQRARQQQVRGARATTRSPKPRQHCPVGRMAVTANQAVTHRPRSVVRRHQLLGSRPGHLALELQHGACVRPASCLGGHLLRAPAAAAAGLKHSIRLIRQVGAQDRQLRQCPLRQRLELAGDAKRHSRGGPCGGVPCRGQSSQRRGPSGSAVAAKRGPACGFASQRWLGQAAHLRSSIQPRLATLHRRHRSLLYANCAGNRRHCT